MARRGARRTMAALALLGGLLFAPLVEAAPDAVAVLRRQARDHVAKGRWAEAADLYGRIPPGQRTADDRDAHQTSLRRALQVRRLRDRPSQLMVAKLSTAQALTVFRDVLETLQARYVDRDKVTLAQLFVAGVDELRVALDSDVFARDYLGDLKSETIQAFRDHLDDLRARRDGPATPREARDSFQALVNAAQGLRLKPGVVLLEFVCGACHSLDEYTLYLGAAQVAEAEAERDGKAVGIGLELTVVDQKVVVARVYRNGPAEAAEIRPGDLVLSIDGQAVDPTMAAATAARLAGEEGTFVDLEILSLRDGVYLMPARTLHLERRVVAVPSVDPGQEFRDGSREPTGIGYIRVTGFQKSTPNELKEAIFDLSARMNGLKALVLDLRGNPGGLFAAALQVAELFVTDGVLAYTQGRTREETHRANNPHAFTMPLVVLIDGDTASAAEAVAGALKERGRATLVGQTTYGKNVMQDVFRLRSLNAGLQITFARFCSPARTGCDGRGVVPDRVVPRPATPTAVDSQRDAAFLAADALARMTREHQ